MKTPETADFNGNDPSENKHLNNQGLPEHDDWFDGEGFDEHFLGSFEDTFDELEKVVYFDSQADLEIEDPSQSTDGRQAPLSKPANQPALESGNGNGYEMNSGSKNRSAARPLSFIDEDEPHGLVPVEEDDLLCSAAMLEDLELMDMLARAAVRAKSSTAAEGLAAAMVPLSIRLHQDVYRALWSALPVLTRGIMRITRKLYGDRARRSHIGYLPVILNETTTQLAQHIAYGEQSLTPRIAARTLSRQVAEFLKHGSTRTRRTGQENRSLDDEDLSGWDVD